MRSVRGSGDQLSAATALPATCLETGPGPVAAKDRVVGHQRRIHREDIPIDITRLSHRDQA